MAVGVAWCPVRELDADMPLQETEGLTKRKHFASFVQ